MAATAQGTLAQLLQDRTGRDTWRTTLQFVYQQRQDEREGAMKNRGMDEAYNRLADVLARAYDQASGGKGKDRHVKADGQKFEDQPICSLQRIYGNGYAFGQVGKKMEESMRMPKDQAVAELLGGIVYLAAAVIVREEQDE